MPHCKRSLGNIQQDILHLPRLPDLGQVVDRDPQAFAEMREQMPRICESDSLPVTARASKSDRKNGDAGNAIMGVSHHNGLKHLS